MKTALCLVILATAPSAWAQAVATSPGKTLATREQYAACLDSADEARARQAALQKRRADYDGAAKQLQADLQAQMEARDKIKPNSHQADAWNLNNEKLNARGAALNTEADAIQKGIAEHNRLTNEARERCANLQVKTEDREAVEAARQKKP
jgi:hypothetical protein